MTEGKYVEKYSAGEKRRRTLLLFIKEIKQQYPELTARKYKELAVSQNWPSYSSLLRGTGRKWSELFPKKPKHSISEIDYLVKEIDKQYPGISYQEYQRLASQKKLISPSTMLRYTGKKWRELFPK